MTWLHAPRLGLSLIADREADAPKLRRAHWLVLGPPIVSRRSGVSGPTVSIATWNIEWKKSYSVEAAVMRERLLACDPEIVCVTEGYTNFFNGAGHLIEADANYGYPLIPGRRKVMLWSRRPWSDVDGIGYPRMPTGRFIAGRTDTSMGELTFIGVCIPWRDAHVRTGRGDRKPWQDHLSYLNGLASYLRQPRRRTVLVGDFNQKIPRSYSPKSVHEALLGCLGSGYAMATAGPLSLEGQCSIDHLAHTRDLHAMDVHTLSNVAPNGKKLSDHFGVALRLASAT